MIVFCASSTSLSFIGPRASISSRIPSAARADMQPRKRLRIYSSTPLSARVSTSPSMLRISVPRFLSSRSSRFSNTNRASSIALATSRSILNNLGMTRCSVVLRAQPDILHRVARLGPITPEAVETLRAMLAGRSGPAKPSAGVTLGGTREAAKILSGARKTTEQRVMPKLFKIDREVAKAIEEALFVFENLLDLDDKNLGTLIRSIDGDVLTRALKGVDE